MQQYHDALRTVLRDGIASTDRTGTDPLFDTGLQSGWTLGQRWRLSNQVNLYNESQFLKEPNQSGLAHTFGMDFYPAQGWNLGFTLSNGELTNTAGGNVDRRAVSVSGGRTSPDTDWQSKLEWREDSGAEQREQWVSTNRLTHKINESWRIAARLNNADTDDQLNPLAGAKFIEGEVIEHDDVDSALEYRHDLIEAVNLNLKLDRSRNLSSDSAQLGGEVLAPGG